MRVTIAIPTIEGREQILITCLAGILGQTYRDWQLLICTTNLETRVADRAAPNSLNNFLKSLEYIGKTITIVHDTERQGPGKAVDLLLKASTTELILRVDDDVILTPRVLEKLIESYDFYNRSAPKTPVIAAPVNGFGSVLVKYPDYWKKSQSRSPEPHLKDNGRYESMNDNFQHHSVLATKAIVEVDFLSGYCLLLDRKSVLEAGYVDENSPRHHKEDWYATLKLKSLGHRLLMRADCLAFHHHYKLDSSDSFRKVNSDEDHSRFYRFRDTVKLPPNRAVGIIDYEP